MSNLRQEIIKSFKLRADFIKWKLLIVSILAATGLGLVGESKIQDGQSGLQNAYLILVLIPLVCLLVDLLCKHNSLRILAIAAFKRTRSDDVESRWEHFAEACGRRDIYSLEEYALSRFTYAVSFLAIFMSLCFVDGANNIWSDVLKDTKFPGIFEHHSSGILFFLSGAVGIYFTSKFDELFEKHRKTILEVEDDFKQGSQRR